jgi:hypothetical protein
MEEWYRPAKYTEVILPMVSVEVTFSYFPLIFFKEKSIYDELLGDFFFGLGDQNQKVLHFELVCLGPPFFVVDVAGPQSGDYKVVNFNELAVSGQHYFWFRVRK